MGQTSFSVVTTVSFSMPPLKGRIPCLISSVSLGVSVSFRIATSSFPAVMVVAATAVAIHLGTSCASTSYTKGVQKYLTDTFYATR